MPDPFRALAIAERLRIFAGAAAILALLGGAGLLLGRPWEHGGHVVEAEVRQFGIITGNHRQHPIITVRLPSGAERQLVAPRLLPTACTVGDKIEIVQKGGVISVGTRGCYR